MAEPTVFIVDDDEAFRDSVQELVSSVGLPVRTFRSALEFLQGFDPAQPGCVVADVRMAHMSGIALQARLKELGAASVRALEGVEENVTFPLPKGLN